jgi:hypothetical protein
MAYIREKLSSLYGQSRVLRDRLYSIGRLMQEAKKRSDQQALGQLILLQSQTKDLFNEQLALEQRLMPFASYFNVRTDLGAFPILLAVSGVAVATTLYLHFEKLQNQGKALDLVAKGFLTPAEAEAIISPPLIGFGGAMGFTLPLLAAGGLGLFFLFGRR